LQVTADDIKAFARQFDFSPAVSTLDEAAPKGVPFSDGLAASGLAQRRRW